jgi:AGCS family alanine or glycine:cation symporter
VNLFNALLAASASPPATVLDRANAFFEWTSGILWGPWLLALLVGTHVYLTVRLGVVQRWLGPAIRLTFRPERSAEGALVSMTGTFWDTVVICLITGLVLVVTGAWKSGLEGPAMTASAFGTIPYVGPPVLTFGLISFVFSTLIGWSYYGEKSLEYLGGLRFVPVYRWLWVVAIFLGATFPSSLVINFSDSANALMAIPNLISLIALAGLAARESKDLLSRPETFE